MGEADRKEQSAAAVARAEELAKDRAALQRKQAELAAQEAVLSEKASLSESLEEQQKALVVRQEALEAEQRTQDEHWQERASSFWQRAEDLSLQQAEIAEERVGLRESRTQLAYVQAHVLSMLEKGQPETAMHRLSDDADDDALEPDAVTSTSGQDVASASENMWTMDWAAANLGMGAQAPAGAPPTA
eukprot:NODE_4629_length_655_cov_281.251667.p1 GENE.NODE_4629_length_655_cov_281.251667~~NODE_4629_length_655_cov_281.251667.p1  ORF type:complete len:188 (+),score=69.57 NODE_4629_length_655_cov_281.251667:3-566(+)